MIAIAGCSSGSGSVPATTTQPGQDSLAAVPEVGPILANSCFDCHANHGSGDWAAKMAPSFMFGAGKARQAFDMSDWETLTPEQRRAMANAIVSAINSGSMPPGDYLTFHPSARLSDQQKQELAAWASYQGQTSAPAH